MAETRKGALSYKCETVVNEKLNEPTEAFVLLKQKKLEQKKNKRIVN